MNFYVTDLLFRRGSFEYHLCNGGADNSDIHQQNEECKHGGEKTIEVEQKNVLYLTGVCLLLLPPIYCPGFSS